MKRVFALLLLAMGAMIFVKTASAENEAGTSAAISYSNTAKYCAVKVDYTKKKMAVKKVLQKYESPLLPYTDAFIATCSKYGIDCYLLPAIAGLESTFGKFILPDSNNAWGWVGGLKIFPSWEAGIDEVGRGLKYNYIDRGRDTVDTIGPMYSESPTWAVRVNIFMREFQREEDKLDSLLTANNKTL
ncbi:glucosaminidase domain-containing protein [Candidatus Roizmanbacteria bacterium]|nr:glucosaminidase domain-containing protein [Candidatus Roizmanbacteria bacterium]